MFLGKRYDNTPMQYTVIFHSRKIDDFEMKSCDNLPIFVQNIDRGYTLEPRSEAVLTCTYDPCFRAVK